MTVAAAGRKVLIVDDDPAVVDFISHVVTMAGLVPACAGDIGTFEAEFKAQPPDMVILDMQLPDTDGVELIRFLGKNNCAAPILLISGMDIRLTNAARDVGRAHGLRVIGCLQKPFSVGDLRTVLDQAFSESAVADRDGSPFGELHYAIEQNQLALHFQPKVELRGGSLAGVEALVRWQHPTRGLIPPVQFIPLAEQTGLIVPLTRWVLDATIAQIGAWRRAGQSLKVAVNIPAEFLNDLKFPETVVELLRLNDVPGELLALEFTETGAMQDIVSAMDVLARLRIRGITLSIDDFGTGYSSLAKLHRMPFNEVKIDRAFVYDADSNEDSRVISRTIISMAHSLRMIATAEGVENKTVWDFLVEAGCDLAQGYFIAKPMDASAFTAWASSWRGCPNG